jgi:hypothetical protein
MGALDGVVRRKKWARRRGRLLVFRDGEKENRLARGGGGAASVAEKAEGFWNKKEKPGMKRRRGSMPGDDYQGE